MKKLLTGIISLALAASMTVPAFAANNATLDGTTGNDITVNGKYQAGPAAADVISVDLVWEAMDFTYTAPSKGDWNAKDHKYENAVGGGWAATSGTNPKITVTNHSNTSIKASFKFTADIAGVDGTFTKDSLVLATAENTERANAPKDETAFSVDGTGIDADKDIGTITVTVAKYDSEAAYKVTAEQFESLVGNLNNYKMFIEDKAGAGDAGNITTLYDGISVWNKMSGNEYIVTYDGTDYYEYNPDGESGEWLKEKVTKADLDEALLFGSILSLLKDSYADLKYNAETKSYESNGTVTVAFQDDSIDFTNVSFSFKNGALDEASFNYNGGDITYSDCGTTEVKLPTNIHEHTYGNISEHDDTHHWALPTCGHTVANKDNPTYNEHLFDENGRCMEVGCKYSKSQGTGGDAADDVPIYLK